MLWAYDVATNGRLQRSHEMSAIIAICKNKGNLSKRKKAPRGLLGKRTAPSEPPVCSQCTRFTRYRTSAVGATRWRYSFLKKWVSGRWRNTMVWAYDVATNGRLRRSHEMSMIVTVLENRVIYQEQEIFERADWLTNGSLGAPRL